MLNLSAGLAMTTSVFEALPGRFDIKRHATSILYIYRPYNYDVASGSEITPCNKIDKPLVVYRFSGNVMTSVTTLCTYDTIITFLRQI